MKRSFPRLLLVFLPPAPSVASLSFAKTFASFASTSASVDMAPPSGAPLMLQTSSPTYFPGKMISSSRSPSLPPGRVRMSEGWNLRWPVLRPKNPPSRRSPCCTRSFRHGSPPNPKAKLRYAYASPAHQLLCRLTHPLFFPEHSTSTQCGVAAGHSGQPRFTF